MKIAALAGGTGAAKLLRGLVEIVDPTDLTVIVNTGDDVTLWGLHISPDIDTVTYALAGELDPTRGFGVTGDSFHCRGAMGRLGEPTYFALGDKDLALHLHRTRLLNEGVPLSRVTEDVAARFGLRCKLLPMSDHRVRTRIRTPEGWLEFQEFFVRERCTPEVLEVVYDGAGSARPAPGVISALLEAEVVLVCPSNPVTSIGPIRAIEAIEAALVQSRARIVALCPIIAGQAVSGPAGKLLRARGFECSATGVARAYAPWLDALVIDRADEAECGAIAALGVHPALADSRMTNAERARELARAALRVAP